MKRQLALLGLALLTVIFVPFPILIAIVVIGFVVYLIKTAIGG